MKNSSNGEVVRGKSISSGARAIALALLCGAALTSAPAFANPGYVFKTIAMTEQGATPAQGGFASLGLASINDAGQVAVYGVSFCGGSGSCAGAFTIAPNGSVTKIIDGGAPALGVPYQSFGDAIINHGGAVSFSVLNYATLNTPSSGWLDLWKNGQVQQVAPTRDFVAPANPIYTNARLLNNSRIVYAASDTRTLMIAKKGKSPPQPAAPGYCSSSLGTGSSLNGIVATLGGPAGDSCTNTGILVTHISTGATQLRIANDGTYGALNSVTVNQAAAVAFSSRNLPGRTNVEGLFLQKDGAAVQKLAEIDNGSCANAPPPTGSCQYRGYVNSLAINPKGQVLTNVSTNTWTSGNPNPQTSTGVALNGDAQNGRIVWPGMVINGCTVGNALIGPRAINKFGQIVVMVTCTQPLGQGRFNQALIVATPPVKP